jgi:hypothetical protein
MYIMVMDNVLTCFRTISSESIFLIFQSEKDYDPFAERRRPTIAEKEDEYRQKRRMMIISPERVDPFAEGLSTIPQLALFFVGFLPLIGGNFYFAMIVLLLIF